MTSSATNHSPAHFNWHPAVHAERFGETLCFVMVRLREPLHRPVADQVRDLLQSAGVEYACEYSIFGWWDALIRVWLTPVSYNRLLRTLADSVQHNVDEFRGFTTNRLYYLWMKNEQDVLAHHRQVLTEITAHTEDITYTAQNPTHTDDAMWTRLSTAGLIFPRPTVPEGSVKFYTTLERTNDKMSVDEEIPAIMRAMNGATMATSDITMARHATLYCGAGTLADYLIRCVADTYADVLALAASFDEHLSETRLRPMTLLIANTDARESDNINDFLPISLHENNDAELLDLDNAGVLARMPQTNRMALHRLVVQACELPDTDTALRGMLLAILRATATNNYTALQDALGFLLAFEPLLKKLLLREWVASFGNDWYGAIKTKCMESDHWRRHGEEMEKTKIEQWTLGTYIFTALAACDFEPGFRGRLAAQLGDDWKKDVERLLDRRNDLAHGRVYEFVQLDTYDVKLSTFLDEAMHAAVLWRRCVTDSD